MTVLIMTAIWPTLQQPAFGSFVRTQAMALQRAGVEIEVLVLSGRYRKLNYAKAILQLHSRLREKPIDLVHAHFGYVGMVTRTQTTVPLVVTYHGSDVLGRVNEQGTTTMLSKSLARMGCILGRFVDAVIVQSREMKEHFTGANVHVIPHEIDFDIFRLDGRDRARALLGLDPTRKYLLFAASPAVSVKRFPLAKAAVDHLRKEHKGVELVVVHNEPQPRLALYMNACDALVFPSYQEGSPNVVKQAMACNLPIVATDVGDVRELIGNTDGCYVCSPDPVEFAMRLQQILSTARRTTGRDQVRRFDSPLVTRRIVDIYEDVLKRRRQRTIITGT